MFVTCARCLLPVDMSFGTIDIAYTVDVPRCWPDRIGVMQVITLMLHIELSLCISYLL